MSVPQSPKVMPKHLRATYLGDQETLIEETRGTKWYYFPGPIVFVLVTAAMTYLGWGASMGWAFTHTYWSALTTLGKDVHVSASTFRLAFAAFFSLLLIVGLLWLVVRYLRWISTVYAVTSHRVIIQKGILGRNFDQIPVSQVRGVDVHQSFGQRLLRYGTLRVSSEGGAAIGNEDWKGIPQPFLFQRRLENVAESLDPSNRPPSR